MSIAGVLLDWWQELDSHLIIYTTQFLNSWEVWVAVPRWWFEQTEPNRKDQTKVRILDQGCGVVSCLQVRYLITTLNSFEDTILDIFVRIAACPGQDSDLQ